MHGQRLDGRKIVRCPLIMTQFIVEEMADIASGPGLALIWTAIQVFVPL